MRNSYTGWKDFIKDFRQLLVFATSASCFPAKRKALVATIRSDFLKATFALDYRQVT
jgi:hypothetical protein